MRPMTCFVLLAMSACAPADVAGDYTASTTNGADDCGFGASSWEEGANATNIPVVVMQDGATVQLDVGGITGGALDLFVGSSLFDGTVGGGHVSAEIVGSRAYTRGGCTYTLTLELEADLSGDTLSGEVAWRPVTNRHADCGTLEDCRNVQRFNAVRPPR